MTEPKLHEQYFEGGITLPNGCVSLDQMKHDQAMTETLANVSKDLGKAITVGSVYFALCGELGNTIKALGAGASLYGLGKLGDRVSRNMQKDVNFFSLFEELGLEVRPANR